MGLRPNLPRSRRKLTGLLILARSGCRACRRATETCQIDKHSVDIQKIMAKLANIRPLPYSKDWHEFIETRQQQGIGIDINNINLETTPMLAAHYLQRGEHVMAEVTIIPAVEG